MKENNFVPIDVYKYAQMSNGNIYKALVIMGKRSNQLTVELKEELSRRLSEFAPSYDNLEEVGENKEQEDISKLYERKPKTTQVSLEEFGAGKVYWREP